MLFNSFEFLLFFIIVTSLFFALPHKFRWFLLLTASCYFYMAFVPVYILILGFTIVIDYFAGLYLEKFEGRRKKLFLIVSLIANISVLAIFKYYNFLNENLSVVLHEAGRQNPLPFLQILLPIGLSFHTFQAMSYTIEVYRSNQQAERNFGIYALYVMFYPQLVAGPIERPQNLLHQFRERHNFDYQRVTDGIKLMVWGLFKKVVIADRISVIVDNIYDHPHDFTGLTLIIATVFFAFQIFCDFSGYSDIAIGAAQVMGFKLMKNFDRPYHSRSIDEFWKRWHISLSTWFRDYLYIPLGGNRVPVPRWYFNLFIVFLISGLWHGANWTFIIWGALHGFYLVFGIITKQTRISIAKSSGITRFPWLNNTLQLIVTFTLVCFAWIFFRAASVGDAFYIAKHSITGLSADFDRLIHFKLPRIKLGINPSEIAIGVFAIIAMEIIHIFQYRHNLRAWISNQPAYLRWSVYFLAVMTIIFFGTTGEKKFIYFQF